MLVLSRGAHHTWPALHGQPRGLVDDQQRVVEVQHPRPQRLRNRMRPLARPTACSITMPPWIGEESSATAILSRTLIKTAVAGPNV